MAASRRRLKEKRAKETSENEADPGKIIHAQSDYPLTGDLNIPGKPGGSSVEGSRLGRPPAGDLTMPGTPSGSGLKGFQSLTHHPKGA